MTEPFGWNLSACQFPPASVRIRLRNSSRGTGGPLAAQRGHLTVSRNLDFLVSQAATIVEGSVVGWSVAKHERFTNLDILSVTIQVKDVLKGEAGETLTFRQHISDIRDRWDGAGYRKGQKVLLLINQVNRYGLTSTSGVQQGRFRIRRDAFTMWLLHKRILPI